MYIAEIRQREKDVYEKEITRIKQQYERRENETSSDLTRLERLQADRVSELEKEIKGCREKLYQNDQKEIVSRVYIQNRCWVALLGVHFCILFQF